jgi:transcriptional regulator with XRE-family HTH domain
LASSPALAAVVSGQPATMPYHQEGATIMSTFTNKLTPQQLKRRRRQLGFSSRLFADLAGVSAATVNHTESGRVKPSIEIKNKLLGALDRAERNRAALPSPAPDEIRPLRLQNRLTQQQLAERAGLSQRTIEELETGHSISDNCDELKAALQAIFAVFDRLRREQPENIRPRRLQMKLTLQQLADKAGLSPCTIGDIEKGRAVGKNRVDKPKPETLQAIFAALDQAQEEQADPQNDFRELRRAAGLRMKELAKLSGIDRKTIRSVENRDMRPKPRTLKKLRGALAVLPQGLRVAEIRERRLAFRMTKQELCDEAGVANETLRRIENGENYRVSTLRRLNEALARQAKENVAETAIPSGKEIREQRRDLGLSQRELARRSGVGENTVLRFEMGRATPKLATVRAIERVFHAQDSATAAADTVQDRRSKAPKKRPKQARVSEVSSASGKRSPAPSQIFSHGPDYRSVSWCNEQFSFTRKQAECVRILWEAHRNGAPDVDQRTILGEVESSMADDAKPRLRRLFKSRGKLHPAWDRFIVKGAASGTFRLIFPLS